MKYIVCKVTLLDTTEVENEGAAYQGDVVPVSSEV